MSNSDDNIIHPKFSEGSGGVGNKNPPGGAGSGGDGGGNDLPTRVAIIETRLQSTAEKSDLESLRADLAGKIQDVKISNATIETKLQSTAEKSDLESLRADLTEKIQDIKTSNATSMLSMVKWVCGTIIGVVAITIAIFRLL